MTGIEEASTLNFEGQECDGMTDWWSEKLVSYQVATCVIDQLFKILNDTQTPLFLCFFYYTFQTHLYLHL